LTFLLLEMLFSFYTDFASLSRSPWLDSRCPRTDAPANESTMSPLFQARLSGKAALLNCKCRPQVLSNLHRSPEVHNLAFDSIFDKGSVHKFNPWMASIYLKIK